MTYDQFGITPLHKATAFGHGGVVALLLRRRHRVDVNATTGEPTCPPEYQAKSRCETALHIAARKDFVPLIATLVGAGASVRTVNKWGDTPYHEAVMRGSLDAAAALLDHGAAPSLANNAGKRARDLAPDLWSGIRVRALEAVASVRAMLSIGGGTKRS